MLPFFLIYGLVIILLYLYKRKNNIMYVRVAFIFIFAFIAMRGNGSGDYFTYLEYSEKIISIKDVFDFSFPMEIGFRVISFLKNYFNLIDQTVIIVMAFICVYIMYYIITKYSEDIVLSTLIYFPILFQFDMHATRTAVAGSFGILALVCFYKNHYVNSSIFLLLAICFHKSACVLLAGFVLIYILKNIHWKKYIYISLCILFVSVFPIIKYVFLNFNINYKIYNYLFLSEFSYPLRTFDPRVILILFLFVISLFLVKQKKSKISIVVSILLLLNISTIMLFRDSTFMALRLSSFFDRFSIIYLPYLIKEYNVMECEINVADKMKKYIEKYKYIFFYTIYIVLYIALVFINTNAPYCFFF